MQAQEHQDLIRANLAAAETAGDQERADLLRKTYAPLLEMSLAPKRGETRAGLTFSVDC